MRQPNLLKRKAMALPLTLVILLFGSVLVATAFYIVQNMYSTSRHSVTHTELYNAAQTGIEVGKTYLWENDLKTDPRHYDGDDIKTVYIQAEDGTVIGPLHPDTGPNIETIVEILDCNYEFAGTWDAEDREKLPPHWVGGEGTVPDAEIGPPEGTSVIIDPSRLFNLGGGGAGQRRYVIRSTARHDDSDMEVTIETMVVVRKP